MLLTCEKCQTIFRIEETMLTEEQQRVRCSVCAHIWVPPRDKPALPDNALITETASRLRMPAFLLMLIILVATALYMFRGPVTAQVPELIAPFELIGLGVKPEISLLAVSDLKADYHGNLLRVRGSVINSGSFRAHAAPLLVTIIDENGAVLATERILPDDRFINSGGKTEFFLQIEVENASTAGVRVVLLSERLRPSFF